MKNLINLFKIITVMTVIVFGMSSCENSSKGSSNVGTSTPIVATPDVGSKTIIVEGIDAGFEGNFFGFGITSGATFGTPLAGGEGHISGGKATSTVKKTNGSTLDNGTYYVWINIYRSSSRTDMQGAKYFRSKNTVTITSATTSLNFSDFEFSFETPILP